MKKTVDVEIAGLDFVLRVDAYELLANYLEEIESVFSSLPEKREIVEDIESRIAEELMAIAKKSKIIHPDHILMILDKIGQPEEIHHMLNEFDYDKKVDLEAQLYRDPENTIIAGVCSGIAAYFGLDPVIVRIFFILFTLLWGVGVLFYLILWIAIPKAQTSLQKMQMHGGGNVLRKIDKGLRDLAKRFKIPEMTEKIEEKIHPIKRKSKRPKRNNKIK